MRAILGSKRTTIVVEDGDNETEPWLDWVKRATRDACRQMEHFDIPCWVEEARKRKFQWAGHIARLEDGRWTRKVLDWTPDGRRLRGRPVLRWVDSLRAFFREICGQAQGDSNWMGFAHCRESWKLLTQDYVQQRW